MKKIILIALMALGFTAVSSAQSRAVGLRGGYGFEVSYQYNVGTEFVQADLGMNGHGLNFAATYNWSFAQPDWTDRGEWNAYAGPGAALGLYKGITLCAAGMVGLEYTFWFPLQLSVDMRPHIGVWMGSSRPHLDITGFWPAISARYKF
jgi:hypothetical protein